MFFISFLSFAIPFLVNRNQVKKEETEELYKCNTGKRRRTKKKCKDDVFDGQRKKNNVEMPFILYYFYVSLIVWFKYR